MNSFASIETSSHITLCCALLRTKDSLREVVNKDSIREVVGESEKARDKEITAQQHLWLTSSWARQVLKNYLESLEPTVFHPNM